MTNNIITIIKLSFECLLSARTYKYAESSKDIFHLIIEIILTGIYIPLSLFLFKLRCFLVIPLSLLVSVHGQKLRNIQSVNHH